MELHKIKKKGKSVYRLIWPFFPYETLITIFKENLHFVMLHDNGHIL